MLSLVLVSNQNCSLHLASGSAAIGKRAISVVPVETMAASDSIQLVLEGLADFVCAIKHAWTLWTAVMIIQQLVYTFMMEPDRLKPLRPA